MGDTGSCLTVSTLDDLLSIATNGIPEDVTSIKISEELSTIKVGTGTRARNFESR